MSYVRYAKIIHKHLADPQTFQVNLTTKLKKKKKMEGDGMGQRVEHSCFVELVHLCFLHIGLELCQLSS